MLLRNRKKLGDILVESGKITKDQLEYAIELQKKRGDKLGKILVDEGMVSEDDIMEILEYQLGVPHVKLDKYIIDPEVARTVPETIARKYNIIPIKRTDKLLTVAMSDPMNIFAIDEIKLASGLEVQPAIASEDDIKAAIEFYYGKQTVEKAIEDFKKEYKVENNATLEKELMEQVNNAPVVRLVNSIIEQAVVSRASDIHIEPGERKLRIRFRIDGELHEIMSTSMQTHGAVVARIKIMSNLNIAERRLPQDGRIEIEVAGKSLDLRISVLPTVYGEKVVIRILDRSSFLMSKRQLGFNEDSIQKYEHLLHMPYGIILVTGPTGSGKTTTLYAALRELNSPSVNIITLEDPVEYRLEGINQIQINPKIGLTFASGLRAILRQDPNIIMVGEIRDEETANLAVRAAITGHLVLSTLHTNDAASSVVRLLDMGVEPYLASAAMAGVIAQRLVRKICPECKTKYLASEQELKILGFEPGTELELYKGRGCSSCNGTGYWGRTAVNEIMLITRKHRELITQRQSSDKLIEVSREQGMQTLKENCIERVIAGITTLEEMLRVVYTQD
ncbi:MAG TPA: type II secretion system ATPase GspE [Thermoanaerobacterales bacterium]|nr:type II secretion system ATPase GspE [Thermoanaerobacterales bacterium]